MLAQALSRVVHDVIRFQGDADTAIVSDVLDITCSGGNVAELG